VEKPHEKFLFDCRNSGRVSEILGIEGQVVAMGDVIARLDIDDRQVRLEKAKAKTAEENRKYQSSKNLGEKGYIAKAGVVEALAAQAEDKQIELEIERTNIQAAFNGIPGR